MSAPVGQNTPRPPGLLKRLRHWARCPHHGRWPDLCGPCTLQRSYCVAQCDAPCALGRPTLIDKFKARYEAEHK